MAFGILISTLFMPEGGPNFGWTFLCTLIHDLRPSTVNYFIFFSTRYGSVFNFGVYKHHYHDIKYESSRDDALVKMPLFVWSWLLTAYLLIAVMPVLAGVVTMMLMDINFGTSFFDAPGVGIQFYFNTFFGFWTPGGLYHDPSGFWNCLSYN